jgi:hypothetical protein
VLQAPRYIGDCQGAMRIFQHRARNDQIARRGWQSEGKPNDHDKDAGKALHSITKNWGTNLCPVALAANPAFGYARCKNGDRDDIRKTKGTVVSVDT